MYSYFAMQNNPQFAVPVSAFLVGQSCCSALKSWAARQRRRTKDVKIFVARPRELAGQLQFRQWGKTS